MRTRRIHAALGGLLGLFTLASTKAATLQVILATDQTPGAIDRNATWVSNGPGTTRELYADGDSVPYFSLRVGGPVIAMSVPIVQPRFRGYVPPPDFWAWQSSVFTRLPEIPESRAYWVDPTRPPRCDWMRPSWRGGSGCGGRRVPWVRWRFQERWMQRGGRPSTPP